METLDILKDAENKRKKFNLFLYFSIISIVVVDVLIAVLMALLLDVDISQKVSYITLVIILTSLGLMVSVTKYLLIPRKRNYLNLVKEDLIKFKVEDKFKNVDYKPNEYIKDVTIINTLMVKKGLKYYGDDLLSGSYHGKNFVQCDLIIDSGSRTAPVIFKGKWIILDNKKEVDNTIIVKDIKQRFLDPRFNNKLDDKLEGLEAFAFKPINANDLPSNLLRAFEKIQKLFPDYLIIGLMKNKIHIAINNGHNCFEAPLFKKIPDDFANLIDIEIGIITSIIDILEPFIN